MAKKKPALPPKRTIQVVVSGEEFSEIDQARQGKTLSAYCAERILGRPSTLGVRGRRKKSG